MNKLTLIFLILLPVASWAQSVEELSAEKFGPDQLSKKMGTTSIIPFFLKNSNWFWFIDRTVSSSGKEEKDSLSSASNADQNNIYYLVDPTKAKKRPLFDKSAIIKQLSAMSSDQVKPGQIRYTTDFSADQQTVKISYGEKDFDYNFTTKSLIKHPEEPKKNYPIYLTGDQSPDRKWIVYARHHNLYLKNNAEKEELALSRDGAENFSFSMNPLDTYSDTNSATNIAWTIDSKVFYTLRKDTRKVKTLTVINSLSSPRPYVNTYAYELPGDKDVSQFELFIGSVENKTLKKVDISKWPDQEVWLAKAESCTKEIFFIRKRRSRDEMELCAVNLADGTVRVLINEVSKPFINEDLFNVAIVNQGEDIIWWSDRSGWGQYYHYDHNGKLINPITTGNWTVGKIVGIDSANKKMIFYGYGKENGINPNYAMVYQANFNGTKIQRLTAENATHSVFLSKDRNFLIDNYSRIDLAPLTVVRNIAKGTTFEIMKSDMSKLYEYGWKQPEQFTVKAKDGITDLYGLMWKPFNFDPNKKYPIISQVYPGPQTETVWTEFTVLDRYNNTSLAQMGFIVVVMGHRGGTPIREAKYYKYGYGNLRDYALEDDKYGLEQLANKYSFIDLTKVGIFGHSGGGMMSTAALCTYPDFYKVAVSSSGNHDNTIYNRTWGETYQGNQPVALNQSLAKNLKGHLLLVTGESDANVNPAATMRMADALIKADKPFDLLVLPGQSHTYEEPYKHYFQKRLREYFAKYLLSENHQ